MTGYGSVEGSVGGIRTFIEVKSVNNRFCDIILKLPPRMGVIESRVKKVLTDNVGRGRVEVFLKEKGLGGREKVVVNTHMVAAYDKALSDLCKKLKVSKKPHLLDVMRLTDLVSVCDNEVNYESRWSEINSLLQLAVKRMEQMRCREGAALKRSQVYWLQQLSSLIRKVSKQSKLTLVRHRRRLTDKISQVTPDGRIDSNRVEVELASLADRIDIVEEVERLQSHMSQYTIFLKKGGMVGRQLDFLLQEMNREANTISSKSQDASVSVLVVEAKSVLEKLREQVQNIE